MLVLVRVMEAELTPVHETSSLLDRGGGRDGVGEGDGS